MSIFTTIKYQLVQNELAGVTNGTLELGTFSTRVLKWFEDQKILVLIDKKPKRVPNGDKFVYQIRYTALDPGNSFFRYTKIHKDTEKDLKDDRFSRGTHSQTGEYDYYGDETRYEKIAWEDRVTSDFIAGDFGMSPYEFKCARENSQEFAIETDEYLKQWLEANTAPMYAYTEVVEEEELAW